MTLPPPSKSNAARSLAPCADRPRDTASAARPKDDAEGVLSALPFTALPEDDAATPPGPRPIAWLTIRTPYRQTPTATSTCACGREVHARGQADVFALVAGHEHHRTVCPLRNAQEGRAAA
ncbi:hypothetical protein ACFXGM_19625 [Streptomyces albidoflavus]